MKDITLNKGNITDSNATSGPNKKHTLPFVFLLVGGLIMIIGSLYGFTLVHSYNTSAIIANLTKNTTSTLNASQLAVLKTEISSGVIYDAIYAVLGIGLVSGIILLVCGWFIYKPKSIKNVKILSIVAIIFSVVALIFGAGFLIGPVLGIIGGILGYLNK